ncbi:hypothetical protein [Planktothrix agardhii]|jgi:hypothetical protein|uniref:hypothetical protein n=1 Tax=Planktothrix agardhii TaxID=1160 RepID=UPI002B1EE704|nr:hypothetical protein [Planktothrix agardhii]MEA5563335.1 hypothetical protein [Planktothrix agardhii UHCC 0887]
MLNKKFVTLSLITLSYLGSVGVLSTLTTGCDLIKQDKSLSASKAERMVNKWKKSDGTIKVLGVRENPDNTAVATLEVSNLKIKTEFLGAINEENFSGSGQAAFSRYTDGSWVLTGLVFGEGLNSFFVNNLNIKDD